MTYEDKMLQSLMHGAKMAFEEGQVGIIRRYCQSEIEQMMAAALTASIVFREKGKWLSPWPADRLKAFASTVHLELFDCVIAPQVKVGRFVVDFALAFPRHDMPPAIVAVECDGHDFHDRTKQQVARDKARDRFMAERQIPVLRFTGSEIWKDAYACAEQVRQTAENVFDEAFNESVERGLKRLAA